MTTLYSRNVLSFLSQGLQSASLFSLSHPFPLPLPFLRNYSTPLLSLKSLFPSLSHTLCKYPPLDIFHDPSISLMPGENMTDPLSCSRHPVTLLTQDTLKMLCECTNTHIQPR